LCVSHELIGSGRSFGSEPTAIERWLRSCKGNAISVVVRDCGREFTRRSNLGRGVVRAPSIVEWMPHGTGYNAPASKL
jgi:hypothetical protein